MVASSQVWLFDLSIDGSSSAIGAQIQIHRMAFSSDIYINAAGHIEQGGSGPTTPDASKSPRQLGAAS